jgi:hypothetical protein
MARKLQAQEVLQGGGNPGMNFAGVNVRHQPSHRIPHRQRIVQGRQRIYVLGNERALVPAPNPTQFGSLVGMGVEIAAAARGGGCGTALARLSPSRTS